MRGTRCATRKMLPALQTVARVASRRTIPSGMGSRSGWFRSWRRHLHAVPKTCPCPTWPQATIWCSPTLPTPAHCASAPRQMVMLLSATCCKALTTAGSGACLSLDLSVAGCRAPQQWLRLCCGWRARTGAGIGFARRWQAASGIDQTSVSACPGYDAPSASDHGLYAVTTTAAMVAAGPWQFGGTDVILEAGFGHLAQDWSWQRDGLMRSMARL